MRIFEVASHVALTISGLENFSAAMELRRQLREELSSEQKDQMAVSPKKFVSSISLNGRGEARILEIDMTVIAGKSIDLVAEAAIKLAVLSKAKVYFRVNNVEMQVDKSDTLETVESSYAMECASSRQQLGQLNEQLQTAKIEGDRRKGRQDSRPSA